MANKGHRKVGWILIVLGAFFLCMYLFDWQFHWSVVLMVAGAVVFGYGIFSREHSGIFPGSLILLLGLFFFLRQNEVLQDSMEKLWPLILIILGFSFLLTFLFRPQDWGVLIPGGILLVIGLLFFLRNYRYVSRHTVSGILQWWPLILVIIGIRLALGARRS
jgi:hypothetical protein